jgi:hypothetical protein
VARNRKVFILSIFKLEHVPKKGGYNMRKISTVGIVSISMIAILVLISAIGNVAEALPGVTVTEGEGDTTNTADARPCDFQIFGDVQHPAIDSVEEICVIDAIQGTPFELVGLNDDLKQILIDYAQNNYSILVYGNRSSFDQIEVSALVDAYNKRPLVYIKDYTNHSYDFYINPSKYRTRIWLNDGVTYMDGETAHQVWNYSCVNFSGRYTNLEETFIFEKMVGYDINDEDNNYINITEITQQLNYSSYECFTPGRDYWLKRFVSGANGPQLDEHSTDIARQSEPFHIDIGNSTDPYRTISVTQDPEGTWKWNGGWIHCLCFHVGNVSDVTPDPTNMSCDFQIFGLVQHPAIDSVEEICVIDAIQGTHFELVGLNDDLNQILIEYARNNYRLIVYGKRSSDDRINVSALVDSIVNPRVYIKDLRNHSYDFYINPSGESRTRMWLKDGVTSMAGETVHRVIYEPENLTCGYEDLEETFIFGKKKGYNTSIIDTHVPYEAGYTKITEITHQLNYSTCEWFTQGRDYWLRPFAMGANGLYLSEDCSDIARQSKPFRIEIANSTDHYRTVAVNQVMEGTSWHMHGGWIHCLTFHVGRGFTDVASEYGANDSHQGRATVWFDYDNDGDLDLLITVSKGNYTILYRNDGDTFVDVAEEVGLSAIIGGLSVGDYDNDGDLDILCGWLFRNDIDTMDSFTEVGSYGASLFVDYDNDGDLDIYQTRFWESNKLYRNDEEAGFVEIPGALGADDSRHSRSSVWADYDNDGDMDLYVVNGRGERCSLYRNDVDTIGLFTDVTDEMNVGDRGSYVYGGYVNRGYANGASWGDYDNDGDLDLYLAICENGLNRLYRNDVSTLGTFTEVGKSLGVADNIDGFHASWGDYDNDGDLDLYAVNGAREHSRLYRNDVSEGNGFVETGEMANEGAAMGGSWGDFDGDGDLDYYLVGSYPDYVMTNRLYQNDNSENGNHWLHINAIGTTSNRAAIGTTIKVVAGDLVQIRYVESTSGYGSQNSLPVEFGLGDHSTVDSVIINWPSDIVQTLTDVEVNQFLTVYEPVPGDV